MLHKNTAKTWSHGAVVPLVPSPLQPLADGVDDEDDDHQTQQAQRHNDRNQWTLIGGGVGGVATCTTFWGVALRE